MVSYNTPRIRGRHTTRQKGDTRMTSEPRVLWRCMVQQQYLQLSDQRAYEEALMEEADARAWLADKREYIKRQKQERHESFTSFSQATGEHTTYWIEPVVVGPKPGPLPNVQTTCSCCGGTGLSWKPKYRKEFA
jgi:hypothetical protein